MLVPVDEASWAQKSEVTLHRSQSLKLSVEQGTVISRPGFSECGPYTSGISTS